MNTVTKLADNIIETLTPLVDNDYIFLDLPYYTNIGDTLIWKGTEDFLKTIKYKCLYKTSIENYIKPKISSETVILLQGGGNFGDLWRRHTDFCLQIIKDFPDNKIIVMPQTIYYSDMETLKSDAMIMSKHSNFHICARDKVTYKLLEDNFNITSIQFVPDMAFCISQNFLDRHKKNEKEKVLFFNRKDKEHADYDYTSLMNSDKNLEEHEWPSMERNSFSYNILRALQKINRLLGNQRIINYLIDMYCINIFMPQLLRVGINFISTYKKVYSTRLHGAILSYLLQKELVFFDNSYGKNKNVYDAWLKGSKGIIFIKRGRH